MGPAGRAAPPRHGGKGGGEHTLPAATDGGFGASWIPAPHKPGPVARGCSLGDARPHQEARLGLGGCLRGAAAGPPGPCAAAGDMRWGPAPAGTAVLGVPSGTARGPTRQSGHRRGTALCRWNHEHEGAIWSLPSPSCQAALLGRADKERGCRQRVPAAAGGYTMACAAPRPVSPPRLRGPEAPCRQRVGTRRGRFRFCFLPPPAGFGRAPCGRRSPRARGAHRSAACGSPGGSPLGPAPSPPHRHGQAVPGRLSPAGSPCCRAKRPQLPGPPRPAGAVPGAPRCGRAPPKAVARHTQHGGAAPPATPNMAPPRSQPPRWPPGSAQDGRRAAPRASLNMAAAPLRGRGGSVSSLPLRHRKAAARLLWRRPSAARRWRRRCGR